MDLLYIVVKNSSGYYKGSSADGIINGSLNGSGISDKNNMSSWGSTTQQMKRGNSMQSFCKDSPNGNNNQAVRDTGRKTSLFGKNVRKKSNNGKVSCKLPLK